MAKTFIASDESVNSYGYRVLTSGIRLKNFINNPVGLFNHESSSWDGDVYNGPIIRWDNTRIEDGKLIAEAVIDENDPKGKIVSSKVENDFLRAASIGFRIIKTSEAPEDLLPGQTRATVTACELIEISIVDIPANKNALALYDDSGNRVELKEEAAFEKMNLSLLKPRVIEVEPIKPIANNLKTDMKKLTLKGTMLALLSFFGASIPEGTESVEVEPTEDQLTDFDAKLTRLALVEKELETLNAHKLKVDAELSKSNTEVTRLTSEFNRVTTELKGRPAGAPSTTLKEGEEIPKGEVIAPTHYKADASYNKEAEAVLSINTQTT